MMRPFPDLQKKISSSQNGLLLQQNDHQNVRSPTLGGGGIHTISIYKYKKHLFM